VVNDQSGHLHAFVCKERQRRKQQQARRWIEKRKEALIEPSGSFHKGRLVVWRSSCFESHLRGVVDRRQVNISGAKVLDPLFIDERAIDEYERQDQYSLGAFQSHNPAVTRARLFRLVRVGISSNVIHQFRGP
jgi:hypothetical protein